MTTTTNNRRPLQSTTADNIPKSGRTIEETYQKKTQLEHILLRPDTYIGSIEKHEVKLFVWEDDQMVKRTVSYVPGLYKIFDEILVNAADNKQRDPKMDTVKVNIDVEGNCISVYNNGDGIPVEIHQEEGVYVPEMIFGHLLTSSNYDDSIKKTTGGRNGYGAKLANIFSTEFTIETADGKRNRRYKQVFTNNMGKKSEPTITKCKSGENWTMVSFKPDLVKFGMDCLEKDVVALMKKRVVDLAACLGKSVKVELDGKRVPPKTFEDYVKLYVPADSLRLHEKVNERWEICVSISDGHFEQVSFVNNIATIKGGTHVDYIANQIANHLIAVIKKQNKHANLNTKNVKNYLWVFVNALIDNPAFDSQTKETLTIKQSSFGSTCELTPEFLKKVAKSDIVNRVVSWVQFKQEKDLKKTDGNKKGKLNIPKLEEANKAATIESEECTLILTEGDSAKALAMSGLSVVGQDYYGVFPLRGKLLNVREASSKQLQENAEIQNIKKILGLQHGKSYDDVKSLRYGHLMIMADQDHDGSHIKGLLINFLHAFWPSLLKVPNFVLEFITPIVKATNNKNNKDVLAFYTMPEYEEWKENLGHRAGQYTIKYYKGLGTSTGKEGAQYFSDIDKHKKDFVWADDEDGDAIELAFSKKKIEARKNWLRALQAGTFFDSKEKHIPYRDFINKELILFSMADLQRSIPSMVDGLKPGQRKILFCAFKKLTKKEMKVAQFSGYVSEHSAYHHGEQSLVGTIIGMAQNFIGSNNINLLLPNGQFGTRQMGGKDHASGRYIFTKLSPITRNIFHKADELLLNYLNDDGQSIEPTWFIPIIPMVLVNGSEGIGTGWSTFVPNYNPRDIIANLRRLLNGEAMVPMDPWYKWFKGTIQKTASKDTGYTTIGIVEEKEDENKLNDENEDEKKKLSIIISELPIRRWTQEYKEFLEAASITGKDKQPFIHDYMAHNDDTTVHFEVIMTADQMNKARQEGLLKKFKLATTLSTSNMHLFDANGVIKKYDTPEQIVEEFFHLRLDFYEKRKTAVLRELAKALLQLENKVRFIREVVEGTLVVSNRKKADLWAELKNKGYTPVPKEAKPSVAGAVDQSENEETQEEETEEEETEKENPQEENEDTRTEYDYLLSMSIGTLTYEKMKLLWEERDRKQAEFDDLTKTPSNSLWLRDLDALDKQLDEQDKRDAKDEEFRRKQQEKARAKGPGGGGKNAKKPARKPAPKKTNKTEPMETGSDNVPAVKKGRGKAAAGTKKAPAKSKDKTNLVDEDDDEIPSLAERMGIQNFQSELDDYEIVELEDRLARHNIESSPELAEEVPKKKAPPKRAATAKKKNTITEISDDENEIQLEMSDDSDFEIVAPPPEEKKKGGRKAAAPKLPAGATKKRGPTGGASETGGAQRLITEVLKPVTKASPEKKVRKMRPSPFNKKSGSLLGNMNKNDDEEEKGMGVEESSGEVAAAKPRPQRANRKKMTYVLSDSDEDEDVDLDDEEVSEDSDFDDDE